MNIEDIKTFQLNNIIIDKQKTMESRFDWPIEKQALDLDVALKASMEKGHIWEPISMTWLMQWKEFVNLPTDIQIDSNIKVCENFLVYIVHYTLYILYVPYICFICN